MPPEIDASTLSQPITPAPAAPAPVDSGAKELSLDAISDFVQQAEEGGWVDRAPSGGMEGFPDLPSTPEPVVAPSAPVAPQAAPTPPTTPAAPVAPVTPPAPAAVPAPTAATQTPPVAPVVEVSPVAPAPVAPGQAPAAPVAPAAPETPSLVDPFAMVAQQIKAQEGPFIEALAKQEYQITPEDHEAFISGDASKLGLLCARVQANAVRSSMQTMSTYLPVFVSMLIKNAQDEERREGRFWEMNSFLDRNKHRDLIPKVLRTYNQLNPSVDEETRFRTVGLMVAQLNGIPVVPQAAPPGGTPPIAPVVPQAAPALRTPGPVVKTVPQPTFAPPSGGGAPPSVPAVNGDVNPWGDFADFALATERGAFDQRE